MHISTKIWKNTAKRDENPLPYLCEKVRGPFWSVCCRRSIQNSRGSWPVLLHLEPTLPECPSTGERAPKPCYQRAPGPLDGRWTSRDRGLAVSLFRPVPGVGQLTSLGDLKCTFRVSDVSFGSWGVPSNGRSVTSTSPFSCRSLGTCIVRMNGRSWKEMIFSSVILGFVRSFDLFL